MSSCVRRLVAPRSVALCAAALLVAVASSAYAGGPIILAGHDADDHGFTAQYADLFDALYANVTNGGTGILAIGADPGSNAGNWITNVAAQMTVPQTVTFVNNAAISTISFSGYAIIHVPSTTVDTAGGINATTENPLLSARASDIAAFINAGGGLFGLTQDQVADAYDYLGVFADVQATGVPASGDCDGASGSALYDDVTATVLGTSLGITNTNIDGCCWHNTFTSFAPFLQTLATANEPACTSPAINGQASVIGCLQCNIPSQMNLTPGVDLNPVGSQHTVTATLLAGAVPHDPLVGVQVTFTVISGPNAGATGMDTTNASGEATFTYTGNGGVGLDTIRATATDPITLNAVTSSDALKFWDADCNTNSIPDTCDLDCSAYGGACLANFPACGGSGDVNGNGVPDECGECVTDADCQDNLFCTGTDTCVVDTCVHSGDPCSGGNECADTCNEVADTCNEPNGTACTDDGNICTNDTCNGSGVCVHTNNTASCDDGIFCNGVDTCAAGSCTHTGDPCVGPDGDGNCSESCDEAADNCSGPDPNGSICTDGLFCTGSDTCNGGTCSAHTGDPCPGPDGDGSCSESCDEVANNCAGPDPNGSPCTDGFFCTGTDTCNGGTCSTHTGDPCPGADGDGNCAESCNEVADDCTAADPNGSACTDGLYCNGLDTCASGACSGHAGDPCPGPDGDANCAESCDEAADACTATDPNGSACSDGLFCNGADTCSAGACSGHAGDPCPGVNGDGNCAQSCDEVADNCFGADPDGSVCADGLFCNGPDTCAGGDCTNHAGDPCAGPDGDANCAESCNEATDTCSLADPNGTVCDDGAFCNGTDTCSSGTCSVHSGDPCTGTDGDGDCAESCSEAFDDCSGPDPSGSPCEDGLFCTVTDTCDGSGACVGTGNPCPGPDGDGDCAESCDEAGDGCTALDPNGSACDDGDLCTQSDACQAGSCMGAAKNCDDGLFCYDDACNPLNGQCVNSPHDCNDGVACTQDTCNEASNGCDNVPDDSACDDGNDCTDDVCDGNSGCTNANDDTNTCTDDLLCTQDVCVSGACQSTVIGDCVCGNGIQDDAVCVAGDPAKLAHLCFVDADCDVVSGDGSGLCQAEQCEPPSAAQELCDNLIDDDADGLVDCADDDCPRWDPRYPAPNDKPEVCGALCQYQKVCTPILNDPAVIYFNDSPRPDFYRVHGRVIIAPGSFDANVDGFTVSLSNELGPIYSAVVPPGAFTAKGSTRWLFKDKYAKDPTHPLDPLHPGLFQLSLRERDVTIKRCGKVDTEHSLTFKIKVYLDGGLDAAYLADPLDPLREKYEQITTQVYGAEELAFLKARWNLVKKGWRLRNEGFDDLPCP